MEIAEAYIRENDRGAVLLKLFNVHVPSGRRQLREHRHSQFEIVLIKSGSGVYSTARRDYSIKSGDVFVFSSNEQHCITNIDGDSELQLMNLHFEPRYFWGARFDSFTDGNLFFFHSDAFENRLPRNNVATQRVKTLLCDIENEFDNALPEYQLLVRAKVVEIMLLLLRELQYGSENSSKSASIRPVRRAIDYINAHLCEDITLSDIAAAAGMSSCYFSGVFRSTMGIPLWDYIVQKRVEQAQRELELESEDTMLSIALRCGFNNTANFNKAFRRYTGRTPSEYRLIGKAALF